MTDDLLQRFSRLNPVPDPDRLALHGELNLPAHPELRAVLEQARSTNGSPPSPHDRDQFEESTMTTLSPPRQDQPPSGERRARGWVLAAGAAAAAVVFGVIIGVSVLGSDEDPTVAADDDPVVAPVDADTAIAQAYIEARNAYDVDQARALVSEDFRTSEPPSPEYRNLATMEWGFAFAEAYRFEYTDGQCEDPVARPEGVVLVHCDYLWTTELQRITGYPPVPVEFTFRIEDGRIAIVTHDMNHREFSPNVWEPWADFLDEEHPEFNPLPNGTQLELLEQLPEYLDLYEEWVRAQTG